MKIRFTIYVVVGLLLIGFATTTKILYGKWRTAERDRQDSNAFSLAQQQATIQFYTNKLGKETAKVRVLDLSNRNLKALRESDRVKFVQQFEGVKKNLRNIDAILAANATLKLALSLAVQRDSIGRGTFEWADEGGFDKLSGEVFGDSISFDRVVSVPLQGAILWRRARVLGLYRGWPGRKEYEAQLTSPNPNVRITQFELIRIDRKR